ncbi:hypothetical protein KP509_27G010200 [Ceratopteris richardii]|uniref:Protein kinase domain-containing protein n=1 Tax=Ceratopteris richardii TaxID=49495 RepID=A0A8T2RGE7_CERRI|nr:hypothetical protein KP509_27G010200 [Ceratopteris richardii]
MRSASALVFVFVWSLILVTGYGSDDNEALLTFIKVVGNGTAIQKNWTLESNVSNWKGVQRHSNGKVMGLKLPSRNLQGAIPQDSLSQLLSLTSLVLDHNSLSGSLLPDLGNCTSLQTINLSHNNFSGELPSNFTIWKDLSLFSASMNSFTGPIPDSLMHHPTIKTIDLSYNRLNGSLPDLPTWSLTSFNVSNNNLTGALPAAYGRFGSSSFLGTSLCDNPMPACASPPTRKIGGPAIAAMVLGAFIALVLFLLVLAIAFFRTRKTSSADGQSTRRLLSPVRSRNFPGSVPCLTRSLSAANVARPQWLTFFKPNRKFDLDVLLEGPAVALGEGTLGKSFKVDLQTGDSYVVKQLRAVGIGEGAFREKMRTLGLQQHENLMSITAYFWGQQEKLLITEHMKNGSLLGWLQDNAEAKKSVTWDTRIRIALGTAKGIKYLHEHDLPHGRIKASNVLLTNTGVPRLSDYGIAEIVLESEPTGDPNTQMARAGHVLFKQDIHDFGLLLSELFQTKLSSSSMDAGNSEGWSLNSAQPIVESIGERGRKVSDRLRRIVENCLKDSRENTPTIQEVVKQLKKVETGEDDKGNCFPAL